MKSLLSGTIRRAMALLIILAVLPAALIIFNNGMEQRKLAVEKAQRELQNLTRLLAHSQKELIKTTRILFATLGVGKRYQKP